MQIGRIYPPILSRAIHIIKPLSGFFDVKKKKFLSVYFFNEWIKYFYNNMPAALLIASLWKRRYYRAVSHSPVILKIKRIIPKGWNYCRKKCKKRLNPEGVIKQFNFPPRYFIFFLSFFSLLIAYDNSPGCRKQPRWKRRYYRAVFHSPVILKITYPLALFRQPTHAIYVFYRG